MCITWSQTEVPDPCSTLHTRNRVVYLSRISKALVTLVPALTVALCSKDLNVAALREQKRQISSQTEFELRPRELRENPRQLPQSNFCLGAEQGGPPFRPLHSLPQVLPKSQLLTIMRQAAPDQVQLFKSLLFPHLVQIHRLLTTNQIKT